MNRARLRARLDEYYDQVSSVILSKQHPITGLLPASTAVTVHGNYRDAWVRDNVYSSLAVWGLALAYRQLDADGGRGFELRQRTTHLMRSLLRSMMSQAHKVEAFKTSRHPNDALHAKYDTVTGAQVVGDSEWGHLQIDATSLFLLMLAQMIRSGLELIWTTDEVDFVQNLVYYIERAYRTPDYGIWERGAKSNSGKVELNGSSVGMAKAALEALSGFDLFGARGSQRSVIHVSPDNIAQANITLGSMLPRESNTKETDAALLSIIGYPAFAIRDRQRVTAVRSKIIQKLEGHYGLKRFLRDGHQTVVEDEGRLHYEPEELRRFEHIESEWPLFFAYLYLDAWMCGDRERAERYAERLERVLVERDGQQLLPELYYVPAGAVDAERANPGSQQRVPNENLPLVWAQSLYLLGRMLHDGVLQPGDIDPLGRRLLPPPRRPVVQVALLAEDTTLQAELAAHGVVTETPADIAPVTVYLPEHIAAVHGRIGLNEALGITGRAARALKALTTSRFYVLEGKTAVCLASFFTEQEFFLAYDLNFVLRRFRSEVAYLHHNWTEAGRPTITVLLTRGLLDADRSGFYAFMRGLSEGRLGEVPVRRGRVAELLPTAAFERVDDLRGLSLPLAPLEEWIDYRQLLAEPGHQAPLHYAAEHAIDLLDDPGSLLERLATTDNLYEQIELLGVLTRLSPLDSTFTLRGASRSLMTLVEEVYERAGRLRLWAVVRHAAGLLGKTDGDLSLAVTAILVRQKNIQVGRAYSDESLITQPLTEHELLDRIRRFARDDVRDRVLTQELLLYISLLIKAHPELFRDMLTIRVGQLITLLASQLAEQEQLAPDEGYERLMHLAPSNIQQRLERVLAQYHELESLPQQLEQVNTVGELERVEWEPELVSERLSTPPSGWLAWRRHRGTIDRRPPNFYADVWNMFRNISCLIIGDHWDRKNRMLSGVVLSDTTPGEQAFALWLEQLLNRISAAEYRQLTLEALTVLTQFFQQNPKLHIDDALALDAMIGQAVRLAYLERHPERDACYNDSKAAAWTAFYELAPETSSTYLLAGLRELATPRARSVVPGAPSSAARRPSSHSQHSS